MRRWLKVTLVVTCVLLGLVLLLAASGFIIYKAGENAMHETGDMNIETPETVDAVIGDGGQTITYQGKNYRFNENVTSFLVLGIDKEKLGYVNEQIGTGGQADAIYLVTMDTQSAAYHVIAISRDTMAQFNKYSIEGAYMGTEIRQICLSYAYGDGRESSAENTVQAVSRLLCNVPIQSYLAIDLAALPKLTQAVGGLTVHEYDDDGNRTGRTQRLNEDNTQAYLKHRDTSELDSNNARMARQMDYIDAFLNKMIQRTKSDVTAPLNLLNALQQDACTNFDAAKTLYLTTTVLAGGTVDFDILNIEGEVVLGKTDYAEFLPDESSLFETVIKAYYKEVA